jgi:YD repeat-containing protein
MREHLRPCRLNRMTLLAVLFVAALWPARLWAQTPTVTLTRPTSGATNIGGDVRCDITLSAAPSGYTWTQVWLQVFDSGNVLREQGLATFINSTQCYYECYSTLETNGSYTLKSVGRLTLNSNNTLFTDYVSAAVPASMLNPITSRHMATPKLLRQRLHDEVPTASFTSPGGGNQSWDVPVCSWEYKGASFPFYLTYNSETFVDPQSPRTPDFAGMAEVNDKWSHSFCQWITLEQAPNGAQYAMWHRDGRGMAFPAGTGGAFLQPDSFHSLTADPLTSPVQTWEQVQYPCRGITPQPVMNAPYRSFTVMDGDGTKYEFNKSSSQNTLFWVTAECQAVPHWLLSRITDRWGRSTTVNWGLMNVRGVTEPRVTSVTDLQFPDPLHPRLNFTYIANTGLLDFVDDWLGRRHDLSYTQYPNENGQAYYKLTQVDVRGYGNTGTGQTRQRWQFYYGDMTMNAGSYGGSWTGDLVIQKTLPDGSQFNYEYEAVNQVGTGKVRPTEGDWDGRVSRVFWSDPDASNGQRQILRAATTNPATLTWKGGAANGPSASIEYTYSTTGDDLSKVRDVAPDRYVSFSYDSYHNLQEVRTKVEASGDPLVRYTHTTDASGHITQTVAETLRDSGTVGDPVTAVFNALNLPTQITATGNGHPNQVTTLQYDNGGLLAKGNLTQIIEAVGQAEQQTTSIDYTDVPGEGDDGQWGLPKKVTSPVGGVSSFDYHDTFGSLLTARSPVNTAAAADADTGADAGSSVAVLAYGSDGLPSLVQDPLGHMVSVGYAAEATNSPNLVITLTFQISAAPFTATRQVTLDGLGRLIKAVDERNIVTQWSYTPSGQVKTVVQNAGVPTARTTLFKYNDLEELEYFLPPKGMTEQVNFEYVRYSEQGVNQGVQEGQVTHVHYPDNTDEYFGYGAVSGELEWQKRADGTFVRIPAKPIGRDAQHRVIKVQHQPPAPTADNPQFDITYAYDEFGRTTGSSTNADGTTRSTSSTYDSLNRVMDYTPAPYLGLPAKNQHFTFTADVANKRWITQVNCPNIATEGMWEYREDSKGRLYQVIGPFSIQPTTKLNYDLDGKLVRTRFPNGMREDRAYQVEDWLQQVALYRPDNSAVDQFSYLYSDAAGVYDPTGHLRREVDILGNTHAFGYTDFYELNFESHPDIGSVSYV